MEWPRSYAWRWNWQSFSAIVAAHLLYLCGDIEVNPGPPFELNISNLHRVQRLLTNARNEWYNLGLQLGVEPSVLDEIRKDYSTTKECYTEMLKEWLKMINPQPSWEGLVLALAQPIVGCRAVALKIVKDYNVYLSVDQVDQASADDWEDNSNASASTIPESVQRDMDVLEELFSNLVDDTEKVIRESQISMRMFENHLSKLNVRNKTQHKKFLELILPRIARDSTFDDIWGTFCRYFNFLNCSLLEHLIKRLGDTRLVADFEDYKEQLKSFRCKTTIRDFAVYLKELNSSLSKQRLKKFVVKWKKCWDTCTLEDLEKSRQNITEKFFIPTHFLILVDAGPGSVSVTWAVPDIIALSIQENFDRADIWEFCRTEGISSMCVDGNEYNYSLEPVNLCSHASTIGSIISVQNDITALEVSLTEIENSVLSVISEKRSNFEAVLKEFCANIGYKIRDEDVSIDTLWRRLSTHWDFNNIALLECLVYKFGDENLKASMEDYSRKLEDFQSKTRLSDFAMYSVKIGKNSPDGEFSDFVIELDQSSDNYMLKKLESLQDSLTSNLSLSKFTLTLRHIKLRNFTVKWALPANTAALLKEKNVMENAGIKAICRVYQITSITIGGKKFLASDRGAVRIIPKLTPGRQSSRGFSSPSYGHVPRRRLRNIIFGIVALILFWYVCLHMYIL